MKISYFGHSCFYIEGETSVIVDPFFGIGFEMPRVKADLCLSTHSHFDHNAVDRVDYKTAVLSGKVTSNIKGVSLEVIDSYHDNKKGALRGRNSIYKFTVDGITFTHLGDLGEDFNQSLVDKIGKTDLLFIPVGGTYTIDSETAYRYATAIDAKIIVPMHYKTSRSELDIQGVEGFIKKFDNVKNVGAVFMLDNAFTESEKQIYLCDTSGF